MSYGHVTITDGRCHSGFGPPGPDPLADLDPRSKSTSGYGPPLADLDPPENKRSIE